MKIEVKKDVVIYHPHVLIAEKGSVFRTEKGIIFGVIGNDIIMNESSHPKEFAEHFEKIYDDYTEMIEDLRKNYPEKLKELQEAFNAYIVKSGGKPIPFK